MFGLAMTYLLALYQRLNTGRQHARLHELEQIYELYIEYVIILIDIRYYLQEFYAVPGGG